MKLFRPASDGPSLLGLERRLPRSMVARVDGRALGWDEVTAPAATVDDLQRIHPVGYPDDRQYRQALADELGLPWLRWVPAGVLARPMRRHLASVVGATMAAVDAALIDGMAATACGGLTRAGSRSGKGTDVYSDIAVAVAAFWRLRPQGQVLIVDLDRRQGTGYAQIFRRERRVGILDAHVLDERWSDGLLRARIDYPVLVSAKVSTERYLADVIPTLQAALDERDWDLVLVVGDGERSKINATVLDQITRRGLPTVSMRTEVDRLETRED